jgi:hypothetical protein
MKAALLAPDSFSGFLINLHFKVSFSNLSELSDFAPKQAKFREMR